jgi:hypothetical protein
MNQKIGGDKFKKMEKINLLGFLGLFGSILSNGENQSPPLYVNVDLPHYQIEKSREEGERNLVELVKTSDVEESWVYVEKPESNTWYEMGIDQSDSSVRNDLLVLTDLIKDPIVQKYSFYHIHPIREKNPWLMNFPSDKDLGFCVMLGLKFPDKGLNYFESNIVTEHMIYEIECLKEVPLRELFAPARESVAFINERGYGKDLSQEPEDLYGEAEEFVRRINDSNTALRLSVRKTN